MHNKRCVCTSSSTLLKANKLHSPHAAAAHTFKLMNKTMPVALRPAIVAVLLLQLLRSKPGTMATANYTESRMGAWQWGHVFLHCVNHLEMQAAWNACLHGSLTTETFASISAKQMPHSVTPQSLAGTRGSRSTMFHRAVFRFGTRSSSLESASKSSGLRSRYIKSMTSSW